MTLRTVLLASLLTLVPAAALAHPHGDRAERRQRMIERFDADGDGQLSRDEKQQAKKARKLMKKQRRQMRLARKFDRILRRLDRNGDGVVGPDEAGDRFQKLQRFDANQDGWLTRDELPGATVQ